MRETEKERERVIQRDSERERLLERAREIDNEREIY